MKDKKNKDTRLAAGLAGAALLMTGTQAAMPVTAVIPELPVLTNSSAVANQAIGPGAIAFEAGAVRDSTVRVAAPVSGSFSFDQDVLSTNEQVFTVFGTALTGLCAKPFFVFEDSGQDKGSYQIKVGGDIREASTVDISEVLKEKEQQRTMVCSCSSGPAIAAAAARGVLLEDVIDLKQFDEGINTVTVYGEDGYGFPMPLQYVLDKKAMIVVQANDIDLPSVTQLWVADTVSQYFTRKITAIQVTREESVPEMKGPNDAQRAKIKIVTDTKNRVYTVGQPIAFEGYASELGASIAAVEFSLDGGTTWTAYPTAGATAEKWVYWYFSYTPEIPGTYRLTARARTADGVVSGTPSTVTFQVDEEVKA